MHVPLERCWAADLPLQPPTLSCPVNSRPPPTLPPLQPPPACARNLITARLFPVLKPTLFLHAPLHTPWRSYPGVDGIRRVSPKNNYLISNNLQAISH